MENIEATKIESGRTVNTAKKIKLSSYSEVVKNWNEIVNSAIEKEINVNKTDAKPDLNIDSKPEWDLVNINSNEINAYAPAKPIRIIGRGVAQAKSSWDSFRQQNIYSDMGDNSPEFNNAELSDSFEGTHNDYDDNIYQELEDFGYSDDFAHAVEQTIDKPELTDDAENKENASTYTQDLSAIIREATDKISSTSDDYEFEENPSTYTQDLSDIIREATDRISSNSDDYEFEENPSTYTQDLSAIIKEATDRISSTSDDYEFVDNDQKNIENLVKEALKQTELNENFEAQNGSMNVNNLEINDLLREITQISEANDNLKNSIATIENRNEKMLNTYHGIEQETKKYESETLKNAKELLTRTKEEQERLRMREEEVINEGRNIKSNWISADEANLMAKKRNEQLLEMLNSTEFSSEEEVTYKKVA